MEFHRGKSILNEKKLLSSTPELLSSWKKVKSHNFSRESISHFLTKSCLVFLINKKKGSVGLSEYEFPNVRYVDVLEITENKEIIGYDIMTDEDIHKKTPNKLPIITIDLRKAPEKVKESFKILEDYFKKFIV